MKIVKIKVHVTSESRVRVLKNRY